MLAAGGEFTCHACFVPSLVGALSIGKNRPMKLFVDESGKLKISKTSTNSKKSHKHGQ